MKATLTIFFLFIAIIYFAQSTYFEYNNPNVIKINEAVVDLLTSKTWYAYLVKGSVRQNTTEKSIGFSLLMNIDSTYISGLHKGKWSIKKENYIEYSKDLTNNEVSILMEGIFGIIEINDTLLHLAKLQTSSHDMQRHIFFSDKIRSNIIVENSIKNKQKTPNYFIENPSQILLDSISKFSSEKLFFYGFTRENDSIIIETKDKTIKIKWNNN